MVRIMGDAGGGRRDADGGGYGPREACPSCGSFPHELGCEERRRFKESEVRAAGRIMARPPDLYEVACALLAPDGRRALADAMAKAAEEHARMREGDGWRCACDGYRRLR